MNIGKGEKNNRSKLTDEQARQIKFYSFHYKLKDLAKEYGVSTTTISAIRTNKKWKHIEK